MKKRIFGTLVALLCGVTTLFAQSEEYKFNPHWFMQVQGGIGHTRGEAKFKDLISPAAAINAGYKFTETFALRFGVSGWQAKGGWVVNPNADYKYNYIQAGADAMIDFNNLFGKFNPKRVVTVYGFLGVAYNYSFNNDEAVALAAEGAEMRYLWDDSKHFAVGRGGLGLNFRVSDHVGINIEANANTMSDKFNSKKAGNTDWQFNGLVGLTFKFGKSYNKVEKKAAPVTTQPAKQNVEQPVQPIVQPVAQPVKVEPMTRNIVFAIDKDQITEAEMAKIYELANYMKQHKDAKVSIIGYADKDTGNPAYNMALSQRRAEAVAAALSGQSISASRITIDAKGDTIQPFGKPEENRVTICVVE